MEALIAVVTLLAIWIIVVWGSMYFNANIK
jgi:hypothetical protein